MARMHNATRMPANTTAIASIVIKGTPARAALGGLSVQLLRETLNATRNLVPKLAYLVHRLPLRVRQVPVGVPLTGDAGALISAAHGDHDIRRLGKLACQSLWLAAGEIDAHLSHHLDHLGMDSLAGRRACAQGVMSTAAGALEQRRTHLRAPGVVEAGEQRGSPLLDGSSARSASAKLL